MTSYRDTCVFIEAIRGKPPEQKRARALFRDPNREVVSSQFVKLELLPNVRNPAEKLLLDGLFSAVQSWVPIDDNLVAHTADIVRATGSAPIDGLHIACAEMGGVDELITCESPTKPMFKWPPVRTIHISAI